MIGPVIEPVTEPMIEKVRSMWPYKSAESIGLLRAEYLDLDALLDDLTHEVVCRRGRLVQRKIEPAKRKVALAISGGGAAGAYSAGVIEALLGRLRERGIGVDLLVGTSSGALNGFGVLVEELGKANPQLSEDPDLRQPYTSFIASMWSYLDRHGRTSMWIAGRRAWIVDLATRGITTPLKRWGLVTLLALLVLLLNPFLLVSLSGLAGVGRFVPELLLRWGFTGDHPIHFAVLGAVSLLMLAGFLLWVVRAFRFSLISELPLLRLLANTGPQGDLSKLWFWSREKTIDRARVLSRELVKAWYDAAEPPELIVAATDISLGGECLFTLVRPDTYRRLAEADWTAVQLDSTDDAARPYREQKRALFTLPENFLHCILSSTAVPGAFPAQQLGIYGVDGRRDVRHYFVDGGVLNMPRSSPTAADKLSTPTGPPSNFSIMVSSRRRSIASNPLGSTSSISMALTATVPVITPSPFTSAKSRTRRSRRLTIRGVPRDLRAICRAPSASMGRLRIPAERRVIASRSSVE